MRKFLVPGLIVFSMLILALLASAAPTWDKNPQAFVHGIALEIDGETWYFKGPGSVPGVIDIPGHTWVQAGPSQVVGRHYNTGPGGAPSWWATNEPDGVLLYKVHGIIAPEDLDANTEKKLRKQGYVHRHELVNSTNYENPDLMVYLKHIAVRKFYFDSPPIPGAAHYVNPGIDREFIPNW